MNPNTQQLERPMVPVRPVVVELTRSEEIQTMQQVTQLVPVQNGATIFMDHAAAAA